MPPREWRLRIEDMLESIALVKQYTAGLTFGQFEVDGRTIDAVVRRLEIIGEAARVLPADFIERNPQIPWREIRDMRNIVIHVYFAVRIDKVWDTVVNDLPPLERELQRILAQPS